MNQYYHQNHQKRKSKKEKVGFYVALSICLVAVAMAVWSTYASVNDYIKSSDDDYKSSLSSLSPANNVATGITEEETTSPVTEPTTQQPTTMAPTEPTTVAPQTQPTSEAKTKDVLQSILRVGTSLSYPIESRLILNQYSENAVYNKTMGDYRAHTGIDFKGSTKDSVHAMCSGTVEKIYEDEMLGNVVQISTDKYSVYYCGVSKVSVNKGQTVKSGDTIGVVGTVPCEAADDSHIHVEIKVDGQYIDPLAVISSDE